MWTAIFSWLPAVSVECLGLGSSTNCLQRGSLLISIAQLEIYVGGLVRDSAMEPGTFVFRSSLARICLTGFK